MLLQAAARLSKCGSLFVNPSFVHRLLAVPCSARLSPGYEPGTRASSTASVVSSPARVTFKAYYIGHSILFKELFAAHQGRKVLRQDCAILYGPFLTDVSGRLEANKQTGTSTPLSDELREPELSIASICHADTPVAGAAATSHSDSPPSPDPPPSTSAPNGSHSFDSYELKLASRHLQQHPQHPQPSTSNQQQQQKQQGTQQAGNHERQPAGALSGQSGPPSASLLQQPPQQSSIQQAGQAAGAHGDEGQGLLVATRFGAAVFLAVPEEDHWPIIRVLLPGVTQQPVPFSVIADAGRSWKSEPEELQVEVQPSMQRYVEKREDCLWLQRLDVGSVHVIATCIGQSIALQYHMWMLNTMMTQFHALRAKAVQQLQGTRHQGSAVSLLDVLRSVRLLGPAADTHDLARLVAGLNKLRIEMAVGLQLLEYHPMAWQKDRYDQLWALLRREFELEEMHALLNKKLKAVAEEAEYDMDESFQSRYQRLVWVVVGLLVFGNMVDVWDLSGGIRAAVGGLRP